MSSDDGGSSPPEGQSQSLPGSPPSNNQLAKHPRAKRKSKPTKIRSILDMVIEMKDTSELMVDLAYSSLLYNNREIAKEVYKLEDRVDFLNKKIQEHAICDVIKDKNTFKALSMIRLAQSIEVIADSAREIADVVLRDIEPHPILKMSIRESDTTIATVHVKPASIISSKTLGETKLAKEIGMWVIAVRRGKKWIFGPDENTVIHPGDLLFARGPEDGAELLRRIGSGELKQL